MEISIFNLNCWLLPPPLSADSEKRLEAIVGLITARDPDVVTLQEVWLNRHLKYLQKHLASYHCITSNGLFYNKSGLITFLKAPPLASDVKFYKLSFRHNITELIARKGYIETDIEIQGTRWTIVNTHLYAPFLKRTKRIVEEQLSSLISNISNPNVILCGDLNLGEDRFELINNGRLSRIRDEQQPGSERSAYGKRRVNSIITGIEKGKIDYIALTDATISSSEYEVIRTPMVSDHYPIFCRAKLG